MIHNNLNRWMRRNGISLFLLVALAVFFFAGFFLGQAKDKDDNEILSDGLPAIIRWGNIPDED